MDVELLLHFTFLFIFLLLLLLLLLLFLRVGDRVTRESRKVIVMGSSDQSSNDVNLPEDILIDIISRLPTKSVLRFRSVSKSFKNLIDQPLFISIHQSKSFPNLLIHYNDYSISIRGARFLSFNETLTNSQNLNLTSPIFSTISAPCDGILAICHNREQIVLWNLATRQFRYLRVPNPSKLIASNWNPAVADCVFGFGSDSNSSGYKVVLYRSFLDRYDLPQEKPPAQLLVYSLSTNSWRELDMENLNSFWDTERGWLCPRGGLSFNDVYYWFLRNDRNYELWPELILTFNFNDERFRGVAMPDPSSGLNFPSFSVCGGCLAVVGIYGVKLTKVRVWVMVENEYWVQKFEIGPFVGIKSPLGLWKNDYVLLETFDHELVLGDSFGQLREIHSFGTNFYGLIQMFVYGESLVSVKGGGCHGNCSNEENIIADFLSGTPVN